MLSLASYDCESYQPITSSSFSSSSALANPQTLNSFTVLHCTAAYIYSSNASRLHCAVAQRQGINRSWKPERISYGPYGTKASDHVSHCMKQVLKQSPMTFWCYNDVMTFLSLCHITALLSHHHFLTLLSSLNVRKICQLQAPIWTVMKKSQRIALNSANIQTGQQNCAILELRNWPPDW